MNADGGYGRLVTRDHVAASGAVLEELVQILSEGEKVDTAGRDALRVRFGHVDHGGFLTHLLHGFAMLEAASDGLVSSVEERGEIIYALVVNQSIEVQTRTALSFLSSLVARQDLLRGVRDGTSTTETTELDRAVDAADAHAATMLEDSIRLKDWRQAAAGLRERALAGGFVLDVRFITPLLTQLEIRERVPVLRRVYNELPAARAAVDRVASVLSSNFTVEGQGVSEAMLIAAGEILDVGEVRRYLAHMARDTFVCGNGFLQIRPPPDGLRVLRPEEVDVDGDDRLSLIDPGTGERHRIEGDEILHFQGMHQTSGSLGVSVLEPFVILLVQLETAQEALKNAVPLAKRSGNPEHIAWADRMAEFANRQVQSTNLRIEEMLGGGPTSLPTPPPDLYFAGFSELTPVSPELRFGTRSDNVGIGTGC